MYKHSVINTVLFDLDGTLADTALDMARALNKLLREEGCSPVVPGFVRNYVSRGAFGILRRAFGSDLAEVEYESLRERFLAFYAADLCIETRLFPGMAQVL